MNEILKNYYPEQTSDLPPVENSNLPEKKSNLPVSYSESLGDEICELLSSGIALSEVAKMDGKPSLAGMLKWARKHPEFAQKLGEANDIFWELQMLKVFADIAAPLKSSIGASNQIAKLKLEWEAVRVMASKFSSKFSDRPVKGISVSSGDTNVQVIDYGAPNP